MKPPNFFEGFLKKKIFFYSILFISSIIAQMVASTTLTAIMIIADRSGVLRLNRVCAPANPKKKNFNRRVITLLFLVYQ
jgi:hypothetical protein